MRCVVILSGGPDSVTVAYWAKKEGYDVHAITFDYGQIAKKEILHAAEITRELGVPHRIIDLSALSDIYEGVTSLVDEAIPISEEFSQPIIVPFRNGVFMAVAVAYASSIGAEIVLYGATGSDEANYPDCRTEFYEAFQEAARLGTDQSITIDAPFSGMTKADMLKEGVKLGVPFQLTWSCYRNEVLHCGACESCRNRRRAFEESGIRDPTEYMK